MVSGVINNGYRFYFDITPPQAGSEPRFQDEIVIRIKGGKERRVTIQGGYSQRVLQKARRQSVSQIPR